MSQSLNRAGIVYLLILLWALTLCLMIIINHDNGHPGIESLFP